MSDLTPLQQAITSVLDDRDATDEELSVARRLAAATLATRRGHTIDPQSRASNNQQQPTTEE